MDKVSRQVYIDKESVEKIKKIAEKRGISFNTILNQILLKTNWKDIENELF